MDVPLVLIVEDDGFTRSMLNGAIATSGFLTHTESSVSGAMDFVAQFEPAAAVIDLDLGTGPTGLDLAHALRRKFSDIGLVILTSYSDPRLHRPNLPKLPTGTVYLVKSQVSDAQLLNMSISKSIENSQAKNLEHLSDSSSLSDVQIETLRLVAQGLTNAEIAKQRFVAEKTVEQTISRLAKQLNLRNSPSQNQRVHLARIFFTLSGTASSNEN